MRGLFNKYKIEKADGTPTDPHADYFVLRLDKDVFAREAARCYAEKVRYINPKLANDLLYICNCHEGKNRDPS